MYKFARFPSFSIDIPGIMATTTAQKARPSSESKRPYGTITPDTLVTAALKIIAKKGTAGLSMRALAEELGVSSMAAYHHVPNKTALMHMVLNSVLKKRDMSWVDSAETPDEAAERSFLSYFRHMRQYPGLTLFSPQHATASEAVRQRTESVERLLQSNVPADRVETAYWVMRIYMYGLLQMCALPEGKSISDEAVLAGYRLIIDGAKCESAKTPPDSGRMAPKQNGKRTTRQSNPK
ncbi:TetR/AcrR family transcriptional regulator [Paraburkholderia sp. BR14374]|uniref:TetR/AcrR family transcriptional regulator n=1 Tax=Paraburkholderia sp. BR14374 TaxID=3237007 RepID=UPI0034CF7525